MGKRDLALVFRALSDPTRFRVFQVLRGGTYCNCEISERLSLPTNLVSHHVKVLRQAGLVKAQRRPGDARWILYSLDRGALAEARAMTHRLFDPSRVGSRVPPSCLGACPTAEGDTAHLAEAAEHQVEAAITSGDGRT